MKTIKIVITGHVQGVAFRYSAREKALALHLTGWVRNRKDGSVEILAQGDHARVDEMEKWAHIGPSNADVYTVVTTSLSLEKRIQGFIVRPTC